jgi:hypothetical protein
MHTATALSPRTQIAKVQRGPAAQLDPSQRHPRSARPPASACHLRRVGIAQLARQDSWAQSLRPPCGKLCMGRRGRRVCSPIPRAMLAASCPSFGRESMEVSRPRAPGRTAHNISGYHASTSGCPRWRHTNPALRAGHATIPSVLRAAALATAARRSAPAVQCNSQLPWARMPMRPRPPQATQLSMRWQSARH